MFFPTMFSDFMYNDVKHTDKISAVIVTVVMDRISNIHTFKCIQQCRRSRPFGKFIGYMSGFWNSTTNLNNLVLVLNNCVE